MSRAGTRVRLTRLRAALLAVTTLMLVLSFWAVSLVQDTAEVARDRATVAVLGTADVRTALVAADRAAVTTFAPGETTLVGLGQEYTNQLAIANQSLARVAEAHQSAAGTGQLQVVAGLVAAYAGAMAQADAHYRQADSLALGTADLWYASRLLHGPGGVLDQLSDLEDAELAVLDAQLRDGGSEVLPEQLRLLPVALIPPAVLLVLIVFAHLAFRRWFRRRLVPGLLVAALLTVGVGVAVVGAMSRQGRLDAVRAEVHAEVTDRGLRITDEDVLGQRALESLLAKRCVDLCGASVAAFRNSLPPTPPEPGPASPRPVAAMARDAAEPWIPEWLVAVAVVLAGGSLVVGFRARIEEYRYRETEAV
ncbi:hypothetical protein [Actinokineospora enzanensis]|uniref:hypothetical protein n=1 Tax=Actinokineospora enzanensis TaxID=155975 RepID=UPI000363242D|nr:hypothetical protein [Actinokineospora enzanensis]